MVNLSKHELEYLLYLLKEERDKGRVVGDMENSLNGSTTRKLSYSLEND